MPRELPGFQHLYSGKVRDLYLPLQDGMPRRDQLLLVASDRLSAFDEVLEPAIPDKGEILTRMSLWWFDQVADLAPNHVISTDVPDEVAGRAVLVRRLRMLPVEAIARAYLAGTGLKDYVASGSISGVALPEGLVDGSRLEHPIFTPSTKAAAGEHDQLVPFEGAVALLGEDLAARVRDLTVAILERGEAIARERGILLADTKIEIGLDGLDPDDTTPLTELDTSGLTLVLADEVLTPDSSRFWPADGWEPGHAQPSYDKQYVRDWLTSPASGWDQASGERAPRLPEDVVAATRARYVEAYERLTRTSFS